MVDPPSHPLRPPMTRTDEGDPLLMTPGLTSKIPNAARQSAQSSALRKRTSGYDEGRI